MKSMKKREYQILMGLHKDWKVGSKCFCLPLRYGVLVTGVLGCILNVAGLVAYAILQVPGIRDQVMDVFNLGMDISILYIGDTMSEQHRRTELIYM